MYLQFKTSPILLFLETLFWKRSLMFSLLPASNKSFLLLMFGLFVSFGSELTKHTSSLGVTIPLASFIYVPDSFGDGLHFCTTLRPTKGINLKYWRQRWWLQASRVEEEKKRVEESMVALQALEPGPVLTALPEGRTRHTDGRAGAWED